MSEMLSLHVIVILVHRVDLGLMAEIVVVEHGKRVTQ